MDFAKQVEYVWGCRGYILQSLLNTLTIAVFALLIGFVIGIIIATIKVLPKTNVIAKIADKIADVYVTIIRGTPMMVQLLILANTLLLWWKSQPNNLIVPIIAFGINSGAYMAEIIRSGINSIDKGQMEAGRSLGLSWVTTMIKVVIPQAIKVVVPTIFNEIIILVKETSVCTYVALAINGEQTWELMGYAQKIFTQKPGVYVMVLFIIAVIYLVIVLLLTLVQKLIEKRLKASER